MIEKRINLRETYAKKLGMRTTAKSLFQDLDNKFDVLVLNFKDVEFMSMSFAQEYICQKKCSNFRIVEDNMSEFVRGLLDVVEEDYNETYGVLWYVEDWKKSLSVEMLRLIFGLTLITWKTELLLR